MKSVCLYFKIHQPFRLKRYRFFDIGNDHFYYDTYANEEIITRLAEQSYIPMVNTLLEMIEQNGKDFRCAISISGTAIEQLQLHVPDFNDLLKKLADTGCVEFLAGTYSHDISSVEDPEEFMRQVKLHDELIYRNYGCRTRVMNNTQLIYDDDIALLIQAMGYKGVVTEGAKHILGWKSPNFVYAAATDPKLKLLLVNNELTEDITRNFNNPAWESYPLTADKYMDWIAALPEDQQVVNLYFPMDVFGTFLPRETGIFDFMKALPRFAKERGIALSTPSDVLARLKPVDTLSVPYPISDVDESRDVSAWKGNDLQREALSKLYGVAERVNMCEDRPLKQDWLYLQSSDHFFYMSTKNLADGATHAAFSPYESPFAAFTNYMNVLADFIVRVQEQFPEEIDNEELNSLLLTIRNQAGEISQLKKEVKTLRTNILNAEDSNYAAVEVVEIPEKPKEEEKKAEKKAEKIAEKKKTEKKTEKKAEKKVEKKPAKKAEKTEKKKEEKK